MVTSSRRSGWQRLGSLPVAAAVLVACNALYMFLVAFGNITDYDTNHAFVQHVLSMDTTNFGGTPGTDLDGDVMWRAVKNPAAWTVGYIGVIIWESLTAVVLIVASAAWLRALLRRTEFDQARALSSIGLLMIILLFFAGFTDTGGEWFQMWRSTTWNGLEPAFRNSAMAAVTLVLVHMTPLQSRQRRHRRSTREVVTEDTDQLLLREFG